MTIRESRLHNPVDTTKHNLLTVPTGNTPSFTMASLNLFGDEDITKLKSGFVWYWAVIMLDENRRTVCKRAFNSNPD